MKVVIPDSRILHADSWQDSQIPSKIPQIRKAIDTIPNHVKPLGYEPSLPTIVT